MRVSKTFITLRLPSAIKAKEDFFWPILEHNDPTDISVKKQKSIKQKLSERKRIFSIEKQKMNKHALIRLIPINLFKKNTILAI